MLLFAIDYKGDREEFTGDEIVEVWRNGGPGEPPTCIAYCDSSSDRLQDFYDAEYFVARAEVDNWLKRENSEDLRW